MKISGMNKGLLAGFAMTLASVAAPAAATVVNTDVDLELALLVDVSGSVDSNEFALQRDGYVNAFKSAAVQNSILGGAFKRIAVSLVYWSGSGNQAQSIGWTLIDSAAAADAFADAITAVARPFGGLTAPGSAIRYIVDATTGSESFSENAFNGTRNVIDVSGDGDENSGDNTALSRDFALANGIDTINGITIGGGQGLLDFYTNNVIGGPGAFALEAVSFADFGGAVSKKLIREITGEPSAIPLPAAGWLMLAGLGGIAALRRRKVA
jgi:Protein of unknown function (DUF1194)